MILSLEPDSEVPLYQQIRDRIVEAIASGDLPVGSPLPTARRLAADLGINFHTVHKGYDLLRGQGLVHVTRRSGTTIARDPTSGTPDADFLPAWTARLKTHLAEALAQGMPAKDITRHCEAALAALSPHTPPEN